MSKVITCPSGLQGEIRTLTGAELKLFGNRKLARTGQTFTDILKGCWLATVDPGPYGKSGTDAAGKVPPPDWSKVLTGDLMFAFIEIRKLGWGSPYDFTFQCANRSCRQDHPDSTAWSVQLDDLKVRVLTPYLRRAFMDGNRVPYMFGGVPVAYRLMTWADEREAAGHLERYGEDDDNRVLAAMAERLVEVEGNPLARLDRIEWLNGMPAPDITDFQEHLLETDPGPVTGIDVQCKFCKGLIHIDLPFGESWFKRARKAPPSGDSSAGSASTTS